MPRGPRFFRALSSSVGLSSSPVAGFISSLPMLFTSFLASAETEQLVPLKAEVTIYHVPAQLAIPQPAPRQLDAPQALGGGLVDEVVKSDDLRPQVQHYAEDLATKPAAALAAIRRTITLGGGMSFEDGMTLELETATALADTADFAEGVDAFLNKRAPQWSSR